jgi:hypothetical protein
MGRSRVAALAALLLAAAAAFSACAEEVPVPKMFNAMKGQKGQYRVEVLKGGTNRSSSQAPLTMTICTDNLLGGSAGSDRPRAEPGCKYRLLKDTADEAVMESVCPERKSLVTLKREDDKSTLMTMASSGKRGDQNMTMRYTHLGPCREGQGAVTFDKDSEQCKKLRERAAKMDPEKQCARQKSDREACEQRVRDAAKQLSSMCN